MEKGKGLARRWAVELPDASSSSPAVPDPPGFTRSAPDAVTPTPPPPPRSPLRWFGSVSRNSRACSGSQDDAAGARQRKDSETAWKAQVRSIGTVFVLGLVDPGRGQRDLPAMI